MKKNEKILGFPIKQIKPTFIKLLLGSLGIAGIIGIISLLSGEFNEVQSKILLTVILTSGFSVGMLIYLSIMETRYKLLGAIGGSVAAISFLLGVWLIWQSWEFSGNTEYLIKNYFFSAILAFGFAHACLLIRLVDHPANAVRLGALLTIIFIGFLVALLGFQIYSNNFSGGDMLVRIMGVLGILIILGTVITPTWARLQKK